MRLGKVVVGGDEKALTHKLEQISIGSCLRREYGSCWSFREDGVVRVRAKVEVLRKRELHTRCSRKGLCEKILKPFPISFSWGIWMRWASISLFGQVMKPSTLDRTKE